MARIILIHGAWGNASGWVRVVQHLTRAGHQVEAMDLPGHGRSDVPPQTVGQAEYAAAVEARLLDGPPAMLVGHSMGGMVIAQVAARQPEHVTKCVYVAALLPRDGESLVGLIGQQDTPGIQPAVRPGPVPGTTLLDADIAPPILFADASPRDQAAAMAAMSPQPNKAQKDKAQIGPRFDEVPRAYVYCTQDRTVTHALQQRMTTATPCETSFTLECGHVPQMTKTKELCEILDGLAKT